MAYLRIKRGAKKVQANGTRYAIPLVITKTKKYGHVINEQYISRQHPVLITGAHHSGKLTGQIAKECLISVIAISEEQNLPASMRHLVLTRDPQIFRLGTETADDGTHILVYFTLLGCTGCRLVGTVDSTGRVNGLIPRTVRSPPALAF